MEVSKIKEELKQMVPGFAARIQPVYQFLGWKWDHRDKPFVPQVPDILDTLMDLIEGLDEGSSSESSGGLEVFCEEPDEFDLCGYYGFRFKFEDFVVWSQTGKSRFVSVSG